MPTWPATLPQKPLLSDFERRVANATIRSPVDKGPDIVRGYLHRGVDDLPWTNYLTDAQKTTFDDFFRNTLVRGTLAFDMPAPEDGTIVEVRIVPLSEKHHYIIAKRKTDQHLLVIQLEQMP